ncbi:hypothetical protein MOV08_17730 [Streptomyces yunnanensis]|uniref:MarR family transcriptional regulator n=1 Tax=Streptomyces yunnanensis TaxID=156453 RepID=A0ABY8A814_9ACTN|nr:hypothetical protein [Streptomyces yunnanensis]WEB40938.1 hypothetical protein MOV08_17730 [Streptomyces yunnanensis]
MNVGAVWSRWGERLLKAWNRHVRYREVHRQLDVMWDDPKSRIAWVDELTEEELEEMLAGLAECIDAMQGAVSETPERPEGTS